MKRFPELAQLKNNCQRNEIVKAAQGRVTGKFLFGMCGIQVIVMIVVGDWERRLGVDGTYWLFPIEVALFGIGFGLWNDAVNGKHASRTIRQKINEFGTPVCIECGYLLTAITESRCPECGQPYCGEDSIDPE